MDDEFTYIVDFDDIAPFCEFPGAKAGDMAAAQGGRAGWPRNVVNGFTSADGWKLIHYMDTKHRGDHHERCRARRRSMH